jgi:hypothetical protein
MRVSLSHFTPMYCDNHNSIYCSQLNFLWMNYTHWDRFPSYSSSSQAWHHYFAFCFFFFVDCRFFYQVSFYFLFLFSSWQTLDACSCRIVSLRGDVKKYILFCYFFIKGRIIFF